jgi:Cu2+-exporting ATPase
MFYIDFIIVFTVATASVVYETIATKPKKNYLHKDKNNRTDLNAIASTPHKNSLKHLTVQEIATGIACHDFLVSRKTAKNPWIAPKNSTVTKTDQRELSSNKRINSLFYKIDSYYQNLVQTRLNPLLAGKSREIFLKEMANGDGRKLTSFEKQANRRLGVSIIAIGLTVLMYSTGLPLLPLIVPAAFFVYFPWLDGLYKSLIIDRKLSIIAPFVMFDVGIWLTGQYLLATFSYAFFTLFHKIRFITHINTRQSLLDVFELHIHHVWLDKNGIEVKVPIDTVCLGDILIIDSGQLIPVDGIVVSGSALVDQHQLTGESQAVEKLPGDSVLASTLLLAGRLRVRVEKTGSDTVATKIANLLKQTVDDYGNDIAHYLSEVEHTLYPVLLGGLLGFIIAGPYAGIAVFGANLVICTVALKMLNMLNVLNKATTHNVLIKDGHAIEKLGSIDTLVFDKTGTLTLEQPRFIGIHTLAGFSEDDVLILAATAEHKQTHPVALAIVDEANRRELELQTHNGSEYEIGFGIKLMLDGLSVRVGSLRFMTQENVAIPDDIQPEIDRCFAEGISLVFVAQQHVLIGIIELATTLRPEAKSLVNGLKASGILVYILSGDREAPTKKLAEQLGVDKYFADTLPNAKAEIIRKLKAEGRIVGFIGDGINDSIALREADVSLSFRAATQIASDSAQIILMNDNLEHLQFLFTLSHAFNHRIKINYQHSLILSLVAGTAAIVSPHRFVIVQGLYIANYVFGFITASQPFINHHQEIINEQHHEQGTNHPV